MHEQGLKCWVGNISQECAPLTAGARQQQAQPAPPWAHFTPTGRDGPPLLAAIRTGDSGHPPEAVQGSISPSHRTNVLNAEAMCYAKALFTFYVNVFPVSLDLPRSHIQAGEITFFFK